MNTNERLREMALKINEFSNQNKNRLNYKNQVVQVFSVNLAQKCEKSIANALFNLTLSVEIPGQEREHFSFFFRNSKMLIQVLELKSPKPPMRIRCGVSDVCKSNVQQALKTLLIDNLDIIGS